MKFKVLFECFSWTTIYLIIYEDTVLQRFLRNRIIEYEKLKMLFKIPLVPQSYFIIDSTLSASWKISTDVIWNLKFSSIRRKMFVRYSSVLRHEESWKKIFWFNNITLVAVGNIQFNTFPRGTICSGIVFCIYSWFFRRKLS